jgi:hypothetical protein
MPGKPVNNSSALVWERPEPPLKARLHRSIEK